MLVNQFLFLATQNAIDLVWQRDVAFPLFKCHSGATLVAIESHPSSPPCRKEKRQGLPCQGGLVTLLNAYQPFRLAYGKPPSYALGRL